MVFFHDPLLQLPRYNYQFTLSSLIVDEVEDIINNAAVIASSFCSYDNDMGLFLILWKGPFL